MGEGRGGGRVVAVVLWRTIAPLHPHLLRLHEVVPTMPEKPRQRFLPICTLLSPTSKATGEVAEQQAWESHSRERAADVQRLNTAWLMRAPSTGTPPQHEHARIAYDADIVFKIFNFCLAMCDSYLTVNWNHIVYSYSYYVMETRMLEF